MFRRKPSPLINPSEGILTQYRDEDSWHADIKWCTPAPDDLLHHEQVGPVDLMAVGYYLYPIGHVEYLELLDQTMNPMYLPSQIVLELPYRGMISQQRLDAVQRACGKAAARAVKECFALPHIPYRQVLLSEAEVLAISASVQRGFLRQ